MTPNTLIDTSSSIGLPAPVWFIELFKALGFTLHQVPMHLWYAGIVLAMLLSVFGCEHGRRCSGRLMVQMPIIVALGVNFGIVPLLFIQVGFAPLFYPATILMAWFWLSIIVLMIPAYYGVYVYAFGLAEESPMAVWKRAAGWVSALFFLVMGFLFTNGLSLMENVGGWMELWHKQSIHGAVLGLGLNVADLRLWPRWLLTFGLALTTTGAWIAVDSSWFARRETYEYRAWAKRFAWRVYTFGVFWFLLAGSWYVFGTWSEELKQEMFGRSWGVLTGLTIMAPAGPWLLLWGVGRQQDDIGKSRAAFIGLAQFVVLGLYAANRQLVQHLTIRPYYDLTAQPTTVQWSPLVAFLVTFVLGLGVIGWLLRELARLPAEGKSEAA